MALKIPASSARLFVVFALPVILVFAVLWLISPILFGLPLFILSVAILLYSLGRGDFQILLKLYLNSWQRGDLEGAYQHGRGFSAELCESGVDNASELHLSVRKAVFYQGFERWFAVVFWFVLLGPAAALAYRLFRLLGNRPETSPEEQQLLDQAIQFLEWLPARLLAFTFAVVGDFDRVVSAVRAHLMEPSRAPDLLADSGHAALANPMRDDCPADQFASEAEAELSCAQKLISRSVVCWVAVLAVFQLF